MNTKTYIFFLLLGACSLIVACKSDYDKMVEQEKARGGREDMIFMGICFQMTKDSFFSKCLELNRQGLISSGPSNMTAQHKVEGENPPINFNFYPKFKDKKIVRFDGLFDYEGYALWNKDTHAEALLPRALAIAEKWYGPGFLDVSKDNKRVFVKVNRNQRVRVFIKDTRYVGMEVKDMTAPEPEE
jgi:hypothetical protein